MQKSAFDRIKKQNGEAFAKTIRGFDNGIFDVPDIVEILEHAGRGAESAEKLMQYLISLKDLEIENHKPPLNPFELLNSAGYDAIHAATLEEQNSIRKYFAPGEELCTFNDDQRYKDYHMLHVVKDNVDDIKRADFPSPQREDEYGTSVMSIQILKTGGFISIKNRYNHKVPNCDNTHNSNPDNIVDGLSLALKEHFNVDFSSQATPAPEGWLLIDSKLIKYNSEIYNIYFSEDCYVENGEIHKIDKSSEIMLDYLVLDLKTRKVKNILGGVRDTFEKALGEELKDKKSVVIRNNKKENTKSIIADGDCIIKIQVGEITELNLSTVTAIRYNFLHHIKGKRRAIILAKNNTITNLNVTEDEIGDAGAIALANNNSILSLTLNKNNIGDEGAIALAKNNTITSLSLGMNKIGDKGVKTLANNNTITNLSLMYNNIGDEVAIALAKNNTISSLHLHGNPIYAKGTIALESMAQNNKNLILLSFDNQTERTKKLIAQNRRDAEEVLAKLEAQEKVSATELNCRKNAVLFIAEEKYKDSPEKIEEVKKAIKSATTSNRPTLDTDQKPPAKHDNDQQLK